MAIFTAVTLRRKGILIGIIFLVGQGWLLARDAPVTTAGSSSACPGTGITVPVTVTGFTSVKAITLRLDFDSTRLTFTGYANVNPVIAGATVSCVIAADSVKKVIIFWTNFQAAQSLPDGSTLLDLTFTLISGSPSLAFNNTDNSGNDCEYADENAQAMNDLPTESFYHNATITSLGPGQAGAITGTGEVCPGTLNVPYSVPPITNASGYTWTVPPGCTIVSGDNTPSITVNYSAGAMPGNVTVAGVNSCGQGPSSSLPVSVLPYPGAAGPITGNNSVCAGTSGVIYSVAPIPEATSYAWDLPPGASIVSGNGTTSIVVNFSTGAATGNFLVSGINSCGTGTPSPPFPVIIAHMPAASGTVSGPPVVCAGTNGVVYSISPVENATGYYWTVPPGAIITSGSTTPQIVVSFPLLPGAGVITARGVSACGAGPPSPDFTVEMIDSGDPPVVTASGPLLTSSISAGNQWYYEGTGAIPGATGQTYTATITGWYWTVIQGIGCPGLESNHVYVLFVGGAERESVSFNISPVPNDGVFTISLAPSFRESLIVKVYDRTGNLIYESSDPPVSVLNDLSIDLRPIPPGLYFITVDCREGISVKKMVVR